MGQLGGGHQQVQTGPNRSQEPTISIHLLRGRRTTGRSRNLLEAHGLLRLNGQLCSCPALWRRPWLGQMVAHPPIISP